MFLQFSVKFKHLFYNASLFLYRIETTKLIEAGSNEKYVCNKMF